MKIAYIGHSFHQKTKSTAFFIEILETIGEVTLFWDESWKGNKNLEIESVLAAGFDIIVVFQTECHVPHLARRHPNVIFAPMYDGCKGLPGNYWKSIRGVKVVAFSAAVHTSAMRGGVVSRRVVYFPDPKGINPVSDWSSLRGFAWQRTAGVTWAHVRKLITGTEFSHFTLHGALDPAVGVTHIVPTEEERRQFHLTTTDWFADKAEFLAEVSAANVNFAPRLDEGLGMSFLEAMCFGQVVVAADRPTMNEYLTHGISGLLYDHEHCAPLDFANAQVIGARARRQVERGHARWVQTLPELIDFIRIPTDEVAGEIKRKALLGPEAVEPVSASRLFAGQVDSHQAPSGGARTRGLLKFDSENLPLVTIATVVFNGKDVIAPTMRSVLTQTYSNIEYIVVDGGSRDGTVDYLRSNDRNLDLWVSARDAGPFDAMNKAATLARGRWILFMNAGDSFVSEYAVEDAITGTPGDADFIYGHHVYRTIDGVEHLHKAADFETTWSTLRSGRLHNMWKHGVPCHQATFTRVSLLREHKYDLTYRITADHDFMYRMRSLGTKFHHCDSLVAFYTSGGLSWNNLRRCIGEWEDIALKHAEDKRSVRRFYRERMNFAELEEVRPGDWRGVARLALRRPKLFGSACRRAARSVSGAIPPGRIVGKLKRSVEIMRLTEADWISDHAGLSYPEGWGAWTESKMVVFRFNNPLSGEVIVQLSVRHVFHSCVGKPVMLRFGDSEVRLIPGKTPAVLTARFVVDSESELRLEIPSAGSPKEAGSGTDDRMLGLGLSNLTIKVKSR